MTPCPRYFTYLYAYSILILPIRCFIVSSNRCRLVKELTEMQKDKALRKRVQMMQVTCQPALDCSLSFVEFNPPGSSLRLFDC